MELRQPAFGGDLALARSGYVTALICVKHRVVRDFVVDRFAVVPAHVAVGAAVAAASVTV